MVPLTAQNRSSRHRFIDQLFQVNFTIYSFSPVPLQSILFPRISDSLSSFPPSPPHPTIFLQESDTSCGRQHDDDIPAKPIFSLLIIYFPLLLCFFSISFSFLSAAVCLFIKRVLCRAFGPPKKRACSEPFGAGQGCHLEGYQRIGPVFFQWVTLFP